MHFFVVSLTQTNDTVCFNWVVSSVGPIIKILLCVRLCVCDGCGRGRNGFAGRVAKSSRAFQLSRLQN